MQNGKIEVKTDCFGYKKTERGENCMALKQLYCKNEKCRFYKKSKGNAQML